MQKIKTKIIPIFLVIIAIGFRFTHANNYKMIDCLTFSVMSDLAIRALFGYMSFYLPRSKDRLINFFTKTKIAGIYISFILLVILKIFAYSIISNALRPLYVLVLPIFFSVVFALIIFE